MRENPVAGITDLDDSEPVPLCAQIEGRVFRTYSSSDALTMVLESQVIESDVVLEGGFDELLHDGKKPKIMCQFSGRSLASHRLIIQNTFANLRSCFGRCLDEACP